LPVETRLGAQLTRLSATQMLPWFGTLDNQKDLALAKAKTLEERIQINQLEIDYQIKQSYFKLYEIEKEQAILQGSITIFEALERLALVKMETGKASASDVLRVQLKITELKEALSILETEKTAPQVSINQLLNRALNTKIKVVDDLAFAQLIFDRDTLQNHIQANHPMFRLYELQQDVSKQAINASQLSTKPSFGVGLDYILVNKRGDGEPVHNGRDILQIRGSMKIPINKKKYEAKEREEELKIAAIEQRKLNSNNQYLAQIETAYANYESAKLKINLYQKQKEITTAAIRILETDYSVRGNRFDELLQLENELIRYDIKILKAIVQSHLAKSAIERFVNL